jgi:hypothetical protein
MGIDDAVRSVVKTRNNWTGVEYAGNQLMKIRDAVPLE